MEFSNGSANVASGGNVFNQTSHNLQGGGLGIRETGIIEKLLVGLLNHSLLRLFRRIYIGELPQNGLDDTLDVGSIVYDVFATKLSPMSITSLKVFSEAGLLNENSRTQSYKAILE
jgi:hypothetical protein